MFSMKVSWRVEHAEMQSVAAERRLFHNCVSDLLVIEARGRRYDFQFGFTDSSGASSKIEREMAEQSLVAAVEEIKRVAEMVNQQVVDPAYEELKRSMALIESGPQSDRESSEGWTGDDYSNLLSWMREPWRGHEHRAIWERRVALGYQLGEGPASQKEWFWLNAFPALSGLNLGQKEHPMVATCAGYADRAIDPSNVRQAAAMKEINQKFFG